eukprot:CAMPEP_0185567176 /NCGR_PEP_ID=MMETSP0434-20130131/536_1 /TAXON_ID=626734 ORGANISM="Favella taraikaensis, Strain Fe Narragansett Bay" /NCGR_SAMPLE_ID=MMETSP0434 /ASSEMBLY_ACC=CAM_ASM_000379 /LENGTH=44 /DNA_ID= /DNA_START= /DNA_END= /DNA_ORIENTATION=
MLDQHYNIKVIDFGDAKKENEAPIEQDPAPEEDSNQNGDDAEVD